MPRVYTRKFDWDEVAKRYLAGEAGQVIAEQLGVRNKSVYDALEKLGIPRRSRVTSVRQGTLQCQRCRDWKPDDVFARCQKNPARRHRHKYCRECNTAMKREWRRAHPGHEAATERARRARRKVAA